MQASAILVKILTRSSSYLKEFVEQYSQYENQREIFLQAPSTAVDSSIVSLRDLIDFISHVADCYPSRTAQFPGELIQVLQTHHHELESELREKIVSSLVLLRRKNIIDSPTLLNTLFPILVTTPSKTLRALLFQKILSDLRNSNANATNHRLNRTIQKILQDLLSGDKSSSKGLWAVKLTRELWKRQIWTDSRAVEIMKEAALADNEKVVVGGVRFFLGGDKEREELEDESSDEEAVDIGKVKHQMAINKKNRKKAKLIDNALATVKKKERRKKQPHPLNFSAFHLLHDPQGFAEDVFRKHLQSTKSKLNLEQKLLCLQLVSRLVGLHKLTILSLYSYFLKYLTPRQPSVTSFLASLAQATHNLVPPDVLEPLVMKIANEFVSEAAAAEVASAGLNAIREICVRQPMAINDTLLQDLVMYRKSKDKGVMMAAKGLLSLYREVSANMLKKRDRGKAAALGVRSGERKEQRFGEQVVGEIEGLELLERWKEEQRERLRAEKGDSTERIVGKEGLGGEDGDDENDEEDDDESGWEVDEDESDDSEGWIAVESDEDVHPINSEQPPSEKRPKVAQAPIGSDDDDKENHASEPLLTPDFVSKLATSRILTPADLAKLQELRLSASVNQLLPAAQRKRAAQAAAALQARHADDPLTAAEIEGLAVLSKKDSKSERVAKAQEGKDDRGEHRSTQAVRKAKKEAQGKSTTNKEKARKKNFLMTLSKGKAKNRRSLVETRRVLKAHSERKKRGGKRGNRG